MVQMIGFVLFRKREKWCNSFSRYFKRKYFCQNPDQMFFWHASSFFDPYMLSILRVASIFRKQGEDMGVFTLMTFIDFWKGFVLQFDYRSKNAFFFIWPISIDDDPLRGGQSAFSVLNASTFLIDLVVTFRKYLLISWKVKSQGLG